MAVVTAREELPLLLTMKHVQEITGLSKELTYRLPHRKNFPSVRFGRSIRVLRDPFFEWLDEQAAQGGRAPEDVANA